MTRGAYKYPWQREAKHCPHCGLRYFSDGYHAEHCTGPPLEKGREAKPGEASPRPSSNDKALLAEREDRRNLRHLLR